MRRTSLITCQRSKSLSRPSRYSRRQAHRSLVPPRHASIQAYRVGWSTTRDAITQLTDVNLLAYNRVRKSKRKSASSRLMIHRVFSGPFGIQRPCVGLLIWGCVLRKSYIVLVVRSHHKFGGRSDIPYFEKVSLMPSQREWDKTPIGLAILTNLSCGNLYNHVRTHFPP